MSSACVALSLYADLKMSGVDVGSFADFYADNVNRGNIRGADAWVGKKVNGHDVSTKSEIVK